jgi:hypothetical protein
MNLQSAFASAQRSIAVATGMSGTAAGNFLGPDGRAYTMTFRAADAFEVQSMSREMTLHGYDDRSVIIATATRAQFTAPPLAWRRQKCTRTVPDPSTECLVASVATDDPVFYSFVLLLRQPA